MDFSYFQDSYGKLSPNEDAPVASIPSIDLTARKIAEEVTHCLCNFEPTFIRFFISFHNKLEPILKSYIANTALHCRKGYDIENDKIPYHELFSKFPGNLTSVNFVLSFSLKAEI